MGHSIRGKRKKWSFLAVIVLLLLAVSIYVYNRWPESPVLEMKAAGNTVALARDAGADKYAPDLFRETCKLYDSAMVYWKTENKRFFLNRDYQKTLSYARQTGETGMKAYEKARKKAGSVHHTTAETLAELEKIMEDFKQVYGSLPLPKKLRENFNQAAMIISEAKLAREKGDFHIAEAKLEKAEKMVMEAEKKARKMIDDYFVSLPQWTSMAEEAVNRSAAQHSTVVIVDKMARKCRIYKSGKQAAEFDAEFGPNWMTQKMRKGDQATPEGLYTIVQKKEKRRTIYYKALLINYPNNEDRIRYQRNIADGKVSARHDIGGSIEIHGHGGRGFDWTNGCVALSNKDMDVIFSMVSENTPVVIVGSVEPFEKYLKNAKKKQNGE
jgi:L,D-peptidoglycan transpeptidase YkuD (ErfK/YbiS/YcfS/YnhG family)